MPKEVFCDKVDSFLLRHKMHPDQIDLDDCLPNYVEAMRQGLSAAGGSLQMIPTYVGMDRSLAKNKRVVALDIGGTNLRIATVVSDEAGMIHLEDFQSKPMPGINEPMDQLAFFDLLAEFLCPQLIGGNTVCASFAYAMEATPNLDGKIKGMSKGVHIEGIKGQLFCESVKQALVRKAEKYPDVYVVNDTVATALSAMAEHPDCGGYIGVVVGTGMNTSYVEQTRNIKKSIEESDSQTMLIDVESGGYSGILRGDLDASFDLLTANPGKQTIEKMISGAYLGPLTCHVIRSSSKENLLSPAFYSAFGNERILATADLTKFLTKEDCLLRRVCSGREDEETLTGLIHHLISRASKLVALQIAGAATQSQDGNPQESPILVTVEGSTYERLPGLRQGVEELLSNWFFTSCDIQTKLVRAGHAVLKGAAVVGLTR